MIERHHALLRTSLQRHRSVLCKHDYKDKQNMNKLPFTVNPSLATRNGLRAIYAVTLVLLLLASGCNLPPV